LELQEFGGAVITSSGGETLVWAVFAGDTDYFGSGDAGSTRTASRSAAATSPVLSS
jgi:hypothetical protein